jgi:hypothetical protein
MPSSNSPHALQTGGKYTPHGTSQGRVDSKLVNEMKSQGLHDLPRRPPVDAFQSKRPIWSALHRGEYRSF